VDEIFLTLIAYNLIFREFGLSTLNLHLQNLSSDFSSSPSTWTTLNAPLPYFPHLMNTSSVSTTWVALLHWRCALSPTKLSCNWVKSLLSPLTRCIHGFHSLCSIWHTLRNPRRLWNKLSRWLTCHMRLLCGLLTHLFDPWSVEETNSGREVHGRINDRTVPSASENFSIRYGIRSNRNRQCAVIIRPYTVYRTACSPKEASCCLCMLGRWFNLLETVWTVLHVVKSFALT